MARLDTLDKFLAMVKDIVIIQGQNFHVRMDSPYQDQAPEPV